MKYLGIDFGTKRIGLAVSDEGATFAFPLEVLPNDKKLLEELKNVIAKQSIGAIVLGQSVNASGEDNPVMEKVMEFKEMLGEETGLEIFFEKEYFTSHHAMHTQGKGIMNDRKTKMDVQKNVDASAAALILQRYLDRLKSTPPKQK